MKQTGIILFTLLVSIAAWAQKTTVSGTVVSAQTDKPVAGASVVAKGVTVVTNEDGFFTLKSDSAIAALTVSYVGYRSRQVTVADNAANLRIALQPTTIQLQEVLVLADNPRELVNKAISKIPQNYSRQPGLYECFYRETTMKRQHYICVAEGVIDMYKSPYTHRTTRDKVAIRKGRRLLSPKKSDTLSVKVTGGPVTPVWLDLVKNTDFLLNPEDLSCYDMKMEAPTSIGDRMQHVVRLISPRTHALRALLRQALH